MQGTVDLCLRLGYKPEQATLIGKIDDLFEEAIRLDLVSEDEALNLGAIFGRVAGKHTGILK